MAFSSGTYSLYTPGNPVVTGTTIASTWCNNTLNDIATALSTCVLKDGTQTLTANLPMSSFKLTGLGAGSATGNSLRYEQLFSTSAVALLGAMDWFKGADIASAATVNLTTATGNAVHITGAVAITAVTLGSGIWRLVIFDGALTLTHHATNNNLPGGVNITTVAGDRALYWSDGTTVYCAMYQPVTITGTGSGVRATSPTFVTPTLGAASATSLSGAVIAAQADQETSTSTSTVVTPGRQQFHPSAAKVWAEFAGGSTTVNASYNVASVTHNSAGNSTVTYTTAFSGTSYCVLTQIGYTSSAGNFLAPLYDSDSKTASAVNIFSKDNAASLTDPTNWSIACFGDQ